MNGSRGGLGALARVKNEADIIEAFVRHHAALLDHLIIVDNASADGTREILTELQNEGLPLTILDDSTFVYRQAEITTYLARAALATFSFARLFLLDADEFLIASDRDRLERTLATIPPQTHASIPWKTYVPLASDDRSVENPIARIRNRRVVERVAEEKIAISQAFARDPSATIAQGSHFVRDAVVPQHAERAGDLALAHFSVRSPEQLATKTLIGWNAYIAMGYEDAGLGYQWRHAYETLLRGRDRSDEAFYAIAAGWPSGACEPVSADFVREPIDTLALRYGHLQVRDIVLIVAGALEHLSREMASSLRDARTTIPNIVQALERRSPSN